MLPAGQSYQQYGLRRPPGKLKLNRRHPLINQLKFALVVDDLGTLIDLTGTNAPATKVGTPGVAQGAYGTHIVQDGVSTDGWEFQPTSGMFFGTREFTMIFGVMNGDDSQGVEIWEQQEGGDDLIQLFETSSDWRWYLRDADGNSSFLTSSSASSTVGEFQVLSGIRRASGEAQLFQNLTATGGGGDDAADGDISPNVTAKVMHGGNGGFNGGLWFVWAFYGDLSGGSDLDASGSFAEIIRNPYSLVMPAWMPEFPLAEEDTTPTPTGAIMNQIQGANMGSDLFNGTLL